MNYEELLAHYPEMLRCEYIEGSIVYYPNMSGQGRYFIGLISELNLEENTVKIENDQNGIPATSYRLDALQPVFISEKSLIEEFQFEKKTDTKLFGFPSKTFYERDFGEGRKLQIVEASTGRFCLVIKSDNAHGCTFVPVIYVHRLQKIIDTYKK